MRSNDQSPNRPPTFSLCLLTWNERKGCEIDLPRLNRSDFDEVFAIDGGSIDGSTELLQQHGIPVYTQTRRGLNAAYWQAVETARSDYLIVFFPKGTISPDILPYFKDHLAAGNDMVVASRLKPGGRNEEDDQLLKPRKWAVCCLAALAAFLWHREGEIVWDVLHGVKGFSRRAFLEMEISREGLSIDIEMVVRSYRQRISRWEFPVVEHARPHGSTHFKMLPTGIKLAKYLLRELRKPITRSASRPDLDAVPSELPAPE